MYELVAGALKANAGLAMFGLGSVMVAGFFVLYALDFASFHTTRARVLRLVLGYCGLAVAICGFVTKYRASF